MTTRCLPERVYSAGFIAEHHVMDADEARQLGIPQESRDQFSQVRIVKSNHCVVPASLVWYRKVSVTLPNGELGETIIIVDFGDTVQ